MTIGERIKQLRTEKNITQTDLASIIGTTKQNIYKYENGIITNIPSDKIEAISQYFQVSPAFLMGWDEPVPCETKSSIKETDNKFSTDEIQHIKKYRALDAHGKKAVSMILDVEFERCKSGSEFVRSNTQKQIKKTSAYNSELAIARSSNSDFLNVPDDEAQKEFIVIEPNPDF